MTAAEDLVLARRACGGDEEAFAKIYETNYKQVYFHIVRIMGDRVEAEDLTQEVFLRVHQFLGSYSGSAGLCRWIRKIATNLCIDKMRKKTIAQVPWPSVTSKEGEEQEVEFAGDAPSPIEVVLNREGEGSILEAIAGLPEYYRRVVALYDVMDYRGDEVARELACPVGTVKSRLSRAHALLRAGIPEDQRVMVVAGA